MLLATYYDQIAKVPFAEHYNGLLLKNLGIVIIQLLLSVSSGSKVITLITSYSIVLLLKWMLIRVWKMKELNSGAIN